MENSIQKDLTKKEMRKKIYGMILPVSMENVLQMLAGFVAMAMIGRISTVAIASVGLSIRITQIVWGLFKGIATGSTIYVAQAYGAHDYKKLKSVVQQSLLSVIILVIAIQAMIFWKAELLIGWLGAKGLLLENGALYLRTVSFGLPFMAIMLVVAGVLQGMGNAKTPMKIALIMNAVNVLVSYLLIYGNFGFPPMGIRGSAIATAIAQFVGAMAGLYVLFGKGGPLYRMVRRSFFSFDRNRIFEIYKMGMPSAWEIIFWQLCTILLTKLILQFGEVALAAHQLGLQAESISYMPAVGFSLASTAFIGQAIGAKDLVQGKKYVNEILKGSVFLTSFSVVVLFFFPSKVMALLTNQQEVIDLGVKYLVLMALVQIPQNIAGVLNGALRGAGFTRIPMIVAGTGLWLIRLPVAYILSVHFHLNVIGVWIAITIDQLCRFIISCVLFKKKNIYGMD
ncbi:MATE family efflux transporter [Clostridiaceae bacterium 35-E11]